MLRRGACGASRSGGGGGGSGVIASLLQSTCTPTRSSVTGRTWPRAALLMYVRRLREKENLQSTTDDLHRSPPRPHYARLHSRCGRWVETRGPCCRRRDGRGGLLSRPTLCAHRSVGGGEPGRGQCSRFDRLVRARYLRCAVKTSTCQMEVKCSFIWLMKFESTCHQELVV